VSQQINLYNPLLAPRVELVTGRAVLMGLAVAFGLSLLTWALVAADLARSAGREREQAAQLVELQGAITSLSQQVGARKASAGLEAELARLDGLLRARHALDAALDSGTLGRATGVSDYVRAFNRQAPEGLRLTRFSIAGAGTEIEIEGRTVDAGLIPVYLRQLHTEVTLRGYRFESLTVSKPSTTAAASGAGPASRFLEFRLSTIHPEATSNNAQGTMRRETTR
jgi:hypothetical protein